MSITGWFGRMMPPGFYYKTFMYPAKLWMTYEHFIRKAAGLGSALCRMTQITTTNLNQHCDLLVVGAGPAGLVAAREAARAGARVIIADEQNEFGGSLLASTNSIDGQPATSWVDELVAELNAFPMCRLCPAAQFWLLRP